MEHMGLYSSKSMEDTMPKMKTWTTKMLAEQISAELRAALMGGDLVNQDAPIVLSSILGETIELKFNNGQIFRVQVSKV